MLRSFAVSGPIFASALCLAGAAAAQTGNAAPVDRWSTQCVAPDQASPMACSAEQRVILRETGQQVARFAVQASGPKGERKSAFLVHLPLGLSIRTGVTLSVDTKEVAKLDFQTCDANGCYSGDTLGGELLQAMRAGKELAIGFQDLQKKSISIRIDLAGFAAAFDKVK